MIKANATCGEQRSEVYCRLDLVSKPPSEHHCGVCDAQEHHVGHQPAGSKVHSVSMAVDGSVDTWWQSPSLQMGPDNHFVTVTLDLKQVFQVAYILIRSGPSPRPANWILERSLDGRTWGPWQFFALSDDECWHAFGVEPKRGRPNSFRFDEEVICTSYFSKLEPLEGGEVRMGSSECGSTLPLTY